MNKNAILLDDKYVVSDENGDLKIVSNDSNSEIKEVLYAENEIEEKELELKDNREQLKRATKKIFYFIADVLLTVAIAGVPLRFFGRTVEGYLSVLTVLCVINNAKLIIYGDEDGLLFDRMKKRKSIKAHIEELEEEIPVLKESLSHVIENTGFKVEQPELTDSEVPYVIDYIPSYNNQKGVKVLSLTRKNSNNINKES